MWRYPASRSREDKLRHLLIYLFNNVLGAVYALAFAWLFEKALEKIADRTSSRPL